MSSATSAMPLYLADAAALELQRVLAPVCERVAVAGSVRRRKDVCNDVELVVIPRIDQATKPGDLFPSDHDRLEELMQIVKRGDHPTVYRPRSREGFPAPAWGPRQKKLYLRCQRRWIKAELWITTRGQWGAIFAIRTGDAEFSRGLVTQRLFGGAMPPQLTQEGGHLKHITGRTDDGLIWEPLYTPEESDFFGALNLPVILPEQRTLANLKRLLEEKKTGTLISADPR